MTISRITITMKKDLLKKIDSMIDKKEIRNRSHAIEHVLLNGMKDNGLDTVLIMAGGHGVSLRPITYELPKALIPIKNKPILEHQICMLKRFNIQNIVIAVNYMHEKIQQYFGDGRKFGINIKYIIEERPMGTAGAISLLSTKNAFAMLNVDTLINPNIQEMYTFHKKHDALATLLLTSDKNIQHFGVVTVSGTKIVDFAEKPKEEKTVSRLLNAGFCIFDSSVIKMVPRKKIMVEKLFKKLVKSGRLHGFLHDGRVYDVGTYKGYEQAIKEWKA